MRPFTSLVTSAAIIASFAVAAVAQSSPPSIHDWADLGERQATLCRTLLGNCSNAKLAFQMASREADRMGLRAEAERYRAREEEVAKLEANWAFNAETAEGDARDAQGSAAATSPSLCPTNLAHLSSELPDYDDAGLDSIRGEILGTDLRAHFDNLVSQGNSPQQIAAAAAQQAAEGERAMPSAEAVVRSVTSGADAERIFSELKAGTFQMNEGVTGGAGRAWALANYMKVANRESAVALACMARR